MKKTILILAMVVLALIIIAGVIGLFYIGPIVKVSMERLGPAVAKVSIKVESVDVSLLSGSASVKGLVVGNPDGYTNPQAMSVGTIAVSLDPLSVTSNKILIHSVHVQSPEITFEGGVNRNNLSKILDNVNSFTGSNASASNKPQANPSGGVNNKPAPKIEVDDFLITGAKVHVNLSGMLSKDISLPDIHLTDLGKNSNGLTPAELSRAVLKVITRDTLTTVTGTIENLGLGVKSLGVNAVKKVGNDISKVTGSFGGLLGK